MNVLSSHALNRLQRYRGRLEAAQSTAQQAQQLAATYYEQYLDLLRALCEEADIDMPREGISARVDIDWKTGGVTWESQPPNGVSVDGFGGPN